MAINLEIGRTSLALEVSAERVIEVRRECEPVAVADAADLYRQAVSSPTRFPALRLALTPDDMIAIVVDDWRHLNVAAPALLSELNLAGVRDLNVTFVGPSGEEPPESIFGIKTERHDPTDTQHRCYVATTKGGRRIYLNRTVVEADQVIVVSETHFDTALGTAGGPLAIFPAMADSESQNGWRALSPPDLREIAEEVSWLLGTVFYVHMIAGPGDSIAQVIGGGPDSFADARKTLLANWKLTMPERADIVIAPVTNVGEHTSIKDVVRALTSARRAVVSGGTIVLCLDGAPRLPRVFEELSNYDSPDAARAGLKKSKADEAIIASRWLKAVNDARVAVLSGWSDDIVEGLFATALTKPSQVQKLIDRGGTVAVLPDAHRIRVVAEGDERRNSPPEST